MGVEPNICGVIFPPWLFQKQVTWFLTLSRACLTFNLVYFMMPLSTPFKIAYPSVSRALILSLNLARRHINLEIYPFHSDAESYCWSQGFEPYHGRAITCACQLHQTPILARICVPSRDRTYDGDFSTAD